MKKLSTFKRTVAAMVLVSYVVTNHFQQNALAAENPANHAAIHHSNLRVIKIPEGIGKITENHSGKSGKTVIVIEDAHAIPEAQRNIAKLIEYLGKEYGIKSVLSEGAEGEIDGRSLRNYPDKTFLKKILASYLEAGEISGVNLAAILTDSRFQGLEDWKVYEEGLGYYFKALEESPALHEKLDQDIKSVESQKQTVYSPKLLDLDRKLQTYNRTHQNLAELIETLSKIKSPQTQSPLHALLTLIAKEEGDQAKITKRLSAIAGSKWQEALESYIAEVKEKLFRNDEERALDQKTHELNLLVKLTDLELSRQEWEEIKTIYPHLNPLPARQMAGGPQAGEEKKAETSFSRAVKNPVSPLPLGEGRVRAHIRFYQNAEARDEIFFKHLDSPVKPGNDNNAMIFVAGGFHTAGITKRLKAQNISYCLITPAMKEIPEHTKYREQMQGNVSWKKYFEVKDGKIELGKAFVRAARDKLLEAQSEKGFVLKEWRDELIRDLAKSKQIERAKTYTDLIDETNLKSPEWIKKLEGFIAGLKQLEATNQFTEPNVMRLLEPSTMTSAAIGAALTRNQISVSLMPSLSYQSRPELRTTKTLLEQNPALKKMADDKNFVQFVMRSSKVLSAREKAVMRWRGFGETVKTRKEVAPEIGANNDQRVAQIEARAVGKAVAYYYSVYARTKSPLTPEDLGLHFPSRSPKRSELRQSPNRRITADQLERREISYELTPEQREIVRQEAEFFTNFYLKNFSDADKKEMIEWFVTTTGIVHISPSFAHPSWKWVARIGQFLFPAILFAASYTTVHSLKIGERLRKIQNESESKTKINRRELLLGGFGVGAAFVIRQIGKWIEENREPGVAVLPGSVVAMPIKNGIIFNPERMEFRSGLAFRMMIAHEIAHRFGSVQEITPQLVKRFSKDKDKKNLGYIQNDALLAHGYAVLRVLAETKGDWKKAQKVLAVGKEIIPLDVFESESEHSVALGTILAYVFEKTITTFDEMVVQGDKGYEMMETQSIKFANNVGVFQPRPATDEGKIGYPAYIYSVTQAVIAWKLTKGNVEKAFEYLDLRGQGLSATEAAKRVRSELRLAARLEGGDSSFVIGNLGTEIGQGELNQNEVLLHRKQRFQFPLDLGKSTVEILHSFSEDPELAAQVFQNDSPFAIAGMFGTFGIIWHGRNLSDEKPHVNSFFNNINIHNKQSFSRSELRMNRIRNLQPLKFKLNMEGIKNFGVDPLYELESDSDYNREWKEIPLDFNDPSTIREFKRLLAFVNFESDNLLFRSEESPKIVMVHYRDGRTLFPALSFFHVPTGLTFLIDFSSGKMNFGSYHAFLIEKKGFHAFDSERSQLSFPASTRLHTNGEAQFTITPRSELREEESRRLDSLANAGRIFIIPNSFAKTKGLIPGLEFKPADLFFIWRWWGSLNQDQKHVYDLIRKGTTIKINLAEPRPFEVAMDRVKKTERIKGIDILRSLLDIFISHPEVLAETATLREMTGMQITFFQYGDFNSIIRIALSSGEKQIAKFGIVFSRSEQANGVTSSDYHNLLSELKRQPLLKDHLQNPVGPLYRVAINGKEILFYAIEWFDEEYELGIDPGMYLAKPGFYINDERLGYRGFSPEEERNISRRIVELLTLLYDDANQTGPDPEAFFINAGDLMIRDLHQPEIRLRLVSLRNRKRFEGITDYFTQWMNHSTTDSRGNIFKTIPDSDVLAGGIEDVTTQIHGARDAEMLRNFDLKIWLEKWNEIQGSGLKDLQVKDEPKLVISNEGKKIADLLSLLEPDAAGETVLYVGEPFIEVPYRRKHLSLLMALYTLQRNPQIETVKILHGMPASFLLIEGLKKYGLIIDIQKEEGILWTAKINWPRIQELLEDRNGILTQILKGPETTANDVDYNELLRQQTEEIRRRSELRLSARADDVNAENVFRDAGGTNRQFQRGIEELAISGLPFYSPLAVFGYTMSEIVMSASMAEIKLAFQSSENSPNNFVARAAVPINWEKVMADLAINLHLSALTSRIITRPPSRVKNSEIINLSQLLNYYKSNSKRAELRTQFQSFSFKRMSFHPTTWIAGTVAGTDIVTKAIHSRTLKEFTFAHETPLLLTERIFQAPLQLKTILFGDYGVALNYHAVGIFPRILAIAVFAWIIYQYYKLGTGRLVIKHWLSKIVLGILSGAAFVGLGEVGFLGKAINWIQILYHSIAHGTNISDIALYFGLLVLVPIWITVIVAKKILNRIKSARQDSSFLSSPNVLIGDLFSKLDSPVKPGNDNTIGRSELRNEINQTILRRMTDGIENGDAAIAFRVLHEQDSVIRPKYIEALGKWWNEYILQNEILQKILAGIDPGAEDADIETVAQIVGALKILLARIVKPENEFSETAIELAKAILERKEFSPEFEASQHDSKFKKFLNAHRDTFEAALERGDFFSANHPEIVRLIHENEGNEKFEKAVTQAIEEKSLEAFDQIDPGQSYAYDYMAAAMFLELKAHRVDRARLLLQMITIAYPPSNQFAEDELEGAWVRPGPYSHYQFLYFLSWSAESHPAGVDVSPLFADPIVSNTETNFKNLVVQLRRSYEDGWVPGITKEKFGTIVSAVIVEHRFSNWQRVLMDEYGIPKNSIYHMRADAQNGADVSSLVADFVAQKISDADQWEIQESLIRLLNDDLALNSPRSELRGKWTSEVMHAAKTTELLKALVKSNGDFRKASKMFGYKPVPNLIPPGTFKRILIEQQIPLEIDKSNERVERAKSLLRQRGLRQLNPKRLKVRTFRQLEKEMVIKGMIAYQGDAQAVGDWLGYTRQNIELKLQKFSINREKFRAAKPKIATWPKMRALAVQTALERSAGNVALAAQWLGYRRPTIYQSRAYQDWKKDKVTSDPTRKPIEPPFPAKSHEIQELMFRWALILTKGKKSEAARLLKEVSTLDAINGSQKRYRINLQDPYDTTEKDKTANGRMRRAIDGIMMIFIHHPEVLADFTPDAISVLYRFLTNKEVEVPLIKPDENVIALLNRQPDPLLRKIEAMYNLQFIRIRNYGAILKGSWYEVLGVSMKASLDDVKIVFRKHAHRLRPDRQQLSEADTKEWRRIQDAYAVLSDETRRKKYDHIIRRNISRRFDLIAIYTLETLPADQLQFDEASRKKIIRIPQDRLATLLRVSIPLLPSVINHVNTLLHGENLTEYVLATHKALPAPPAPRPRKVDLATNEEFIKLKQALVNAHEVKGHEWKVIRKETNYGKDVRRIRKIVNGKIHQIKRASLNQILEGLKRLDEKEVQTHTGRGILLSKDEMQKFRRDLAKILERFTPKEVANEAGVSEANIREILKDKSKIVAQPFRDKVGPAMDRLLAKKDARRAELREDPKPQAQRKNLLSLIDSQELGAVLGQILPEEKKLLTLTSFRSIVSAQARELLKRLEPETQSRNHEHLIIARALRIARAFVQKERAEGKIDFPDRFSEPLLLETIRVGLLKAKERNPHLWQDIPKTVIEALHGESRLYLPSDYARGVYAKLIRLESPSQFLMFVDEKHQENYLILQIIGRNIFIQHAEDREPHKLSFTRAEQKQKSALAEDPSFQRFDGKIEKFERDVKKVNPKNPFSGKGFAGFLMNVQFRDPDVIRARRPEGYRYTDYSENHLVFENVQDVSHPKQVLYLSSRQIRLEGKQRNAFYIHGLNVQPKDGPAKPLLFVPGSMKGKPIANLGRIADMVVNGELDRLLPGEAHLAIDPQQLSLDEIRPPQYQHHTRRWVMNYGIWTDLTDSDFPYRVYPSGKVLGDPNEASTRAELRESARMLQANRIYEFLGVRKFRNTFALTEFHFQKGAKIEDELRRFLRFSAGLETINFIAFVLMNLMTMVFWKSAIADSHSMGVLYFNLLVGFSVIAFNIFYNVYPILLQHYNRNRAIHILELRQKKSKTKGIATNHDLAAQRAELRFGPNEKQRELLQKLHLDYDPETGRLRYAKDFRPLQLKSTFLYFRHGETLLMKMPGATRIQGDTDELVNQLTPNGRQRAMQTVEKMEALLNGKSDSEIKTLKIFSSPLGRAVQTAQPVYQWLQGKGNSNAIIVRPNLIETRFGIWNNRNDSDLEAAGESEEAEKLRMYKNLNAFVIPKTENAKSESVIEAIDRAYEELLELDRIVDGGTAIISAHGGIGSFFLILLGSPLMVNDRGEIDWRSKMPRPAEPFILQTTDRSELRTIKDFSEHRRDFRRPEDKLYHPEFRKTFGSEDQRALPKYDEFLGSSLPVTMDGENFWQAGGFAYPLSSEWLWADHDKIDEKIRRQKLSRMQRVKQTVNGSIAEDSIQLFIPRNGTLLRLPLRSPKISLGGMSFDEESKTHNLFYLGRTEVFENGQNRTGNFLGGFHDGQNDITRKTSVQPPARAEASARSELRLEIAAERTVKIFRDGGNFSAETLEKIAQAIVRTGAEKFIEQIHLLLKEREAIAFADVAPEKFLDSTLIDSESKTLSQAIHSLKGGYSIGYQIPEHVTPGQIQDFVQAVKSLGMIKEIIVPQGNKVPDLLNSLLKEAGIRIRRESLRRNIKFYGEQSVAGVITAQPVLNAASDSQWIPIVSSDVDELKDPRAKKFVTALQAAVALLLAQEINSPEKRKEILAAPAALLKKYHLFSGFGEIDAVLAAGPEGLQVNALVVQSYLEWRSEQQALQTSA